MFTVCEHHLSVFLRDSAHFIFNKIFILFHSVPPKGPSSPVCVLVFLYKCLCYSFQMLAGSPVCEGWIWLPVESDCSVYLTTEEISAKRHKAFPLYRSSEAGLALIPVSANPGPSKLWMAAHCATARPLRAPYIFIAVTVIILELSKPF